MSGKGCLKACPHGNHALLFLFNRVENIPIMPTDKEWIPCWIFHYKRCLTRSQVIAAQVSARLTMRLGRLRFGRTPGKPHLARPRGRPRLARPRGRPSLARPRGRPSLARPRGRPCLAKPRGRSSMPKTRGRPRMVRPRGRPRLVRPRGRPRMVRPRGRPRMVRPRGRPRMTISRGKIAKEAPSTMTPTNHTPKALREGLPSDES